MTRLPLQRHAPAKVNLSLHVTGRRPDGYHALDSLVVFCGVGDHLTARPDETLSLAVDGPFAHALDGDTGDTGAGGDGDNLVLRAARRLAERTGVSKGARLTLSKHLPVAAGIGGGSADAAAALQLLCDLWDVALPPADLEALALDLGADVPVCLRGRPTWVSGVGEVLRPAPALPEAWLVLVNPGRPLSTPAVFKARRGPFSEPVAPDSRLAEPVADAPALAQALDQRANDLTAAAMTLCPAIGPMLEALTGRDGCLLARMSGSGPTCFGLFEHGHDAQAAARQISQNHPGWWSAAGPLI